MLNYVCTIFAVSATLVTAIPVEASSPATEDVTTRPLPIPHISNYTIYGNGYYELEWNKVENEECPITGYRLKVYQIFGPRTLTVALDPNENKTLVHDFDIPGADNTWFQVKIPTGHARYENRVQAYCANTVFPLSEAGNRITFHGNTLPTRPEDSAAVNRQTSVSSAVPNVVHIFSLLLASVSATAV